MPSPLITGFVTTALIVLSLCKPAIAKTNAFPTSGTVGVTPHDSYSSSIGVLGCKVNTNRVAYWPPSPDCTNICLSLTYGSRQVNLLRIDQSGGAYDISYDAWNYLYTGHSAVDDPTAGGAVEMTYEEVDIAECKDLINTDDNKLPLSAANSMDFLFSCFAQNGSWVADNYVLYNILDPICTLGVDEECKLEAGMNQPTCPHTLGEDLVLSASSDAVWNIAYPSGKKYKAGTQPPPPTSGPVNGEGEATDDSSSGSKASRTEVVSLLMIIMLAALWC